MLSSTILSWKTEVIVLILSTVILNWRFVSSGLLLEIYAIHTLFNFTVVPSEKFQEEWKQYLWRSSVESPSRFAPKKYGK